MINTVEKTNVNRSADFIIIGGGIAGASAGFGLCRHAKVLILEAEEQLAYHTTGRSAAFYAETYGGAGIRPLTTASKDFFFEGGNVPFLHPRGCLHVAWEGQEGALHKMLDVFQTTCPRIEQLDAQNVLDRAPALKAGGVIGAIHDPDCSDLDVHAILQHYIKAIKSAGGAVETGARVTALGHDKGIWRVTTSKGVFEAPLIVNAAGAWGDEIARFARLKPMGLEPKRRSVITFSPDLAVDPNWPLTLDIEERFYFKPESGRILASPADETPSAPCDVQPEELDIARLIADLEARTDFKIPRIDAKWAGLRTFVADRHPVYGFANDADGFFWCVGQGGWGIQTSPAAAHVVEALVTGGEGPKGVDMTRFSVREHCPH